VPPGGMRMVPSASDRSRRFPSTKSQRKTWVAAVPERAGGQGQAAGLKSAPPPGLRIQRNRSEHRATDQQVELVRPGFSHWASLHRHRLNAVGDRAQRGSAVAPSWTETGGLWPISSAVPPDGRARGKAAPQSLRTATGVELLERSSDLDQNRPGGRALTGAIVSIGQRPENRDSPAPETA